MAIRGTGQSSPARVRRRLEISGLVQGVGFRPYVFREAKKRSLGGWVLNNKQGVVVEVEGPGMVVDDFLAELRGCSLRLARVEEIRIAKMEPVGEDVFLICESSTGGEGVARIPADVAVCLNCRDEIISTKNRRFQYPFTNCTDCGPRFTIIQGIPYDRRLTTMEQFGMCEKCAAEFHNPQDRRFHAQPNACPQCGPQAELLNSTGEKLPGEWQKNSLALLKKGDILAIKGLGGFHLACDAKNELAVERLRQRKRRPMRPFAVMCRDLATVKRYCSVSQSELAFLRSPEAPIVVLRRWPESVLPRSLAPGLGTLGVSLPYTPLHFLLFDDCLEMLVMTSGNENGLPLAKDSQEALQQLEGIADYFLTHNRSIHRRCDDSLLQLVGEEPCMLRRSRGYVPTACPVPMPKQSPIVFAAGGDFKNTFCFLKGGFAWLGPHIGDLGLAETRQNYLEAATDLEKMLEAVPEVMAVDCHPSYYSAKLGKERGIAALESVWHHHAHMASCMGENKLTGSVIGVICDGTGYGRDGTVWGGEILSGDYRDFQRCYHLEPVPMPGGEAAIRYPWRMALAYLWQCLGEDGFRLAEMLFPDKVTESQLLWAVLKKGVNSPLASSCGRLYDAAAALLGICLENSYDGQAPAELSEAARGHGGIVYPFTLEGERITCGGLIRGMTTDIIRGQEAGEIAASFERTVVEMLAAAVERVRESSGLERVVLSGGAFQNPYLLKSLRSRLELTGFQVFTHRFVPANDGGLALGQALVAAWRRSESNVYWDTLSTY